MDKSQNELNMKIELKDILNRRILLLMIHFERESPDKLDFYHEE